ncbi:MAG: hypothetical protein AAF799_07900 [Myxococcota bacterium]
MAGHGQLVDEFEVGPVQVRVSHSCARRDVYELSTSPPLSEAAMEWLRGRGVAKVDSPALLIVEVAGVHQLTVAPALGRVVAMPKLATERPEQREAAMAVARALTAS